MPSARLSARLAPSRGPGWRPDLAGSRLIRIISHAAFLLSGLDRDASLRLFADLGQHCRYVAQGWASAAEGLPRFTAVAGLLYGGIALEGGAAWKARAEDALTSLCRDGIGADGSIPSRNPAELAEVFRILVWASRALEETGAAPSAEHYMAIARIAPCLRMLRLADGRLPHFHGGGRGVPGGLDRALADSRVRDATRVKRAMGYSRVGAGRTVIVLDAARPPMGATSSRAHAGTLAFEMASGKRPMIVNAGPGELFGPDWSVAARETRSHSTVEVDASSSARFDATGRIENAAETVSVERAIDRQGIWLLASHDGYLPRYGLTHERRLYLGPDGRDFRGEDTLSAQSTREKGSFAARSQERGGALPFAVRFHLHPDVDASLDMGGAAVSLRLKSGETWIFRQTGGEIALEASTYLDENRLRPRATKQIVVKAAMSEYAARVNWVLRRTDDGGRATRDLEGAGEPVMPDPAA
ncbi:MAG: heparinase II/III family protein [Rubricella sp.]